MRLPFAPKLNFMMVTLSFVYFIQFLYMYIFIDALFAVSIAVHQDFIIVATSGSTLDTTVSLKKLKLQ
jgi:hypothetical protein